MNAKALIVTASSAILIAAGLRCAFLFTELFRLNAHSGSDYSIEFILYNCTLSLAIREWRIYLGLAVTQALPVFWFAARHLPRPWSIFHLIAIVFGGGVFLIYWLFPFLLHRT